MEVTTEGRKEVSLLMAATPSSHRPVSWTCRFLVWHAHDKPVPRGMKVTGDWYTLLSSSVFCPGSLVQSYSLGTDRRAVQFSLWFNNPSRSSPSTLLIHTSLTPSLSLLPSFLSSIPCFFHSLRINHFRKCLEPFSRISPFLLLLPLLWMLPFQAS